MTESGNKHINIKLLYGYIDTQIAKLEAQVGEQIILEKIGEQKDTEDSTTKVLIRTKSNQPVAVLICSHTTAPELVIRGANTAEKIRTTVGEQLGTAIIRPLCNGYADNLSYTIFPYCHEFSSLKLIRVFQRLRVREHLLRWLGKSTAKAAEDFGVSKETSNSFKSKLQYLEKQHFIDKTLQQAIKFALDRIETGAWQPRHTIDHNDFWIGNILLHARYKERIRHEYPFVIIDWYGANPCGYGIFDLMRIAQSFNLSDRALRRELNAHSIALKCDLDDTRGHLLAALARLHQHLECFPESRYLKMFRTCWTQLNKALHPKL